MCTISIAGLSWHTADNSPLFKDLNLTFGAERTGLVGRNGAGKSTLLRLIAGELSPSEGTICAPPSTCLLRQNPEHLEHATIADLFGVSEQHAILARVTRRSDSS